MKPVEAPESPVRAQPPARFCVAPWLETVLYNDGAYRICSRNHRDFGDWRKTAIEEIWKGESLREFRRQVASGCYPDEDCAACHQAGTYQSLSRILGTPLQNTLAFLVRTYLIKYEEYLALQKIQELYSFEGEDFLPRLEAFEKQVKDLLFRFRLEGHGEHLPKVKKIQNILSVIRAVHEGDPAPPVVGPFRQVQLIAKCNARCVMCPGKFTGEIVSGGAISEGELARAMANPEHIVDFFCNGSEFLLFKGWREVAQALKAGGVASLRLSTNGMLLTEDTIEYLVDNEVVGHLNVSMNAGTPESIERVQKQVKWDRLRNNVDQLINYAEEKKVYFPMSFSFIVMRSNVHELPAFLKLVAEWKRGCRTLDPHVMIMSLENAGAKDYRFFLYDEHPSFAPREEVEKAFREAAQIARREKIVASLYNYGPVKTLQEFVDAGFPVPEFISHPQADQENIEDRVRKNIGPHFEEAYASAKEEMRALYREAFSREAVFPLGEEVARVAGLRHKAVAGLRERLEREISQRKGAEFQNLFARFPDYERYHEAYAKDWAAKICTRLRQDLEVFAWKVFAEFVGEDRESLPDHFGEKYAAVPERARLAQIAVGSRVLCRDFRVWRLVYVADLLVYVENPLDGELLAMEHDFVIGAFLFDEAPGPWTLAFRKQRAKAYFHAELECKYVELLQEGRAAIRAAFDEHFRPTGEAIPYGLARRLGEIREGQKDAFVRYRRGLASRDVSDEIRQLFSRHPDQERLYERYRNRIERFCLVGLEDELRKFELKLFLERLKMTHQQVVDHFGKSYVGVGAERLSPGTLILGADYKMWTFLRRRGGIVYLQPQEGGAMQILPKDFIRGAFLFEDGPEEAELARALRRADLHWRINAFKRKIVGDRKSKTLWYLSCAYRAGLKRVGIATPSDLVIRQDSH